MHGYPLLDIFWTMLWFFLWILWLFLLVRIFMDVFRSDDLSGWGKAGWSVFLVLLPFLGVLVYLIARGGAMSGRERQQAQRSQESFKAYVRETAGSGGAGGTADQLAKLSELKTSGAISEEEYQRAKQKLLV
ncbi:SHOCT domain-containing protein [Kitasatospora sp. NPDC006697]|uniref:SHOCT domain-containing protein n=1 Tax=Kitasatospora sp. NPDC006697 TaxID=3364020 RepID=UPI0036BD5F2B